MKKITRLGLLICLTAASTITVAAKKTKPLPHTQPLKRFYLEAAAGLNASQGDYIYGSGFTQDTIKDNYSLLTDFGIMFNHYVALEGGYMYGNATGNGQVNAYFYNTQPISVAYKVHMNAIYLAARFTVVFFKHLEILLKLGPGYIFGKIKNNQGWNPEVKSQYTSIFGAGVGYKINSKIDITLQWQLAASNFYLFGLGAAYHF